MSPEQAAADDQIDHRADLYAVGVLGYELLTGRVPFGGRSARQVLAAHVTEAPLPIREHRPAVPAEFEAVLMRCLEKRPADRWQSAEELLGQLEALTTPTAGMTPTRAQPAPPARRRPAIRLRPVAVTAAVVGLGAAAWLGRGMFGNGGELPERLAVAPFTYPEGDVEASGWAGLATAHVTRELSVIQPTEIVPETRVQEVARELGTSLTNAGLAEGVQARFVLAGTVRRLGDRVQLEAEFLHGRSGEGRWSVEPVAGPADSLSTILDTFYDRVAAAAVALFDPDLAGWADLKSPAPSLEVQTLYLESLDLFCQELYQRALVPGERAVELAPDYVPALITNVWAFNNARVRGEVRDSMLYRLRSLRDRMTPVERAESDLLIALVLDDDLVAAEQAAQELLRLAPSSYGFQASIPTRRTLDFEEALRRLLAVDVENECLGNWKSWWNVTARFLHHTDRLEEMLAHVQAGRRRFPEYDNLIIYELHALGALGRTESIDSLIESRGGLVEDADFWGFVYHITDAAHELIVHQQDSAAATALYERVLDWFLLQPEDRFPVRRAEAHYLAGRFEEAERKYGEWADYWQGPSADQAAALLKLGREAEAREIASQLAATDTAAAEDALTANRVWLATLFGDLDEAVSILRDAEERGFPMSPGAKMNFHRWPEYLPLWSHPAWRQLWETNR
jgi:TolB-like protein